MICAEDYWGGISTSEAVNVAVESVPSVGKAYISSQDGTKVFVADLATSSIVKTIGH